MDIKKLWNNILIFCGVRKRKPMPSCLSYVDDFHELMPEFYSVVFDCPNCDQDLAISLEVEHAEVITIHIRCKRCGSVLNSTIGEKISKNNIDKKD